MLEPVTARIKKYLLSHKYINRDQIKKEEWNTNKTNQASSIG